MDDMWSAYGVDKHGSYCAGRSLRLWTQDPKKRPFWRVPGRFEKKELEDHLVELFPEGLAPHGWRHMLDRHDFLRDPIVLELGDDTGKGFHSRLIAIEWVNARPARVRLRPKKQN